MIQYGTACMKIKKVFWVCRDCNNDGCSEELPDECQFCGGKIIDITSEVSREYNW